MRSGTALASLAVVLAVVAACGEDRPPCYRGDFVSCACTGGDRGGGGGERRVGYARCSDTQQGYERCVCDGTTPGLDAAVPDGVDADADADADAGGAAGKRGFLEACATNEECASGLCHSFPTKGTFCSARCTEASAHVDCPPPSPGCNREGVCRAP